MLAPRHGLAYVMRPGGGIVAIELASGKVRWRSDLAAKPLALDGDRLVAQAQSRDNALDLVVLDARSGAARGTMRMALPAGVAASVVDTPAGSFRVQAAREASGLVVRWESVAAAGAGPAQGYLPAVNEAQAPSVSPTVITGAAVLDLTAPSMRMQAEPSVVTGKSPTLKRASLEELRAETGAGRQFLSVDGRHYLVTEPVKSAEFTLYKHRWTVYERAGGARLGSVPALAAATPFLVVGKTLYHTAPAHVLLKEGKLAEQATSLRAVNLASGAEQWSTAVRETSFRGPFPP
ncbi:MAG TPA: PQQ-binding-like beta-propeller repeat protein [Thermoanaerobaculia bacterium]|nr:PQQ-binding-like beta-propeller repeat protein [Thermoanaerobaculia bacterium]